MILAVVSASVGFLVSLFSETGYSRMGLPMLASHAFLLPAATFCIGLTAILNLSAGNSGAFGSIAAGQVAGASAGAVSRFAFAFVPTLTSQGLALGAVIQNAVNIGILSKHTPLAHLRAKFDLSRILSALSTHKELALYRAPQDVLNTATRELPGVLLALSFSAQTVGYYWMAYRLLSMPGAVIAEAFKRVFFQRAASLKTEPKKLEAEFRKGTMRMLAGAAPIFGLASFGTPYLFPLILGQEWSEAGYYASWMAIWLGALFINAPAVSIIPVLGINKQYLVFEVTVVLLRVSLLLVAPQFLTALETVALFSILGAILNVGLIGLVSRHLKCAARGHS